MGTSMSDVANITLQELEIVILEQALSNHKMYEVRCQRRLTDAVKQLTETREDLEEATKQTSAQEARLILLKARLNPPLFRVCA